MTQLVLPGAYLMEPKDREKQVFDNLSARPRPGWRLRDRQESKVYVRIDRKRKLPVTVLLRAMWLRDR